MYSRLYVDTLVAVSMFVSISYYSLDIKRVYPRVIVEVFSEPVGRLVAYMAVYLLTHYNQLLGLLGLIPVVLIHLDIVNLLERP